MLYEKHLYRNEDIEYLVNVDIIEYDLKSAGFNISKTFKLLDEKTIKRLEILDKKSRQIELGLLIKNDKEFGKRLNDGFAEARKRFFELNNLQDENVISIKKDAIFTTVRCFNTKVGEYLNFVEKNTYTSYYNINNIEFYYSKNHLHVKGISDDLLEKHKEYMLEFLSHLFYLNETSTEKMRNKFIMEFIKYYKSKQLDIGYYRELNRYSVYRLNMEMNGEKVGIDEISEKQYIDIGYNYFRYIIPILNMVI